VKRRVGVRRVGGAVAGLVLVLLAGCVPTPAPPPTMAEVLDGPATAEVRTAALGLVEKWPASFSVDGVSAVARQVYLTCNEGQNNWKVRDGYRLRRTAHSLVFFGWNGMYEAGRVGVLAKMASLCTLSYLLGDGVNPPSDYRSEDGPDYSCETGLQGRTAFASGRSAKVTITPTRWLDTWDEQRWLSGPQGEALLERLKTRRWLFAVKVSSVFFEDAPR